LVHRKVGPAQQLRNVSPGRDRGKTAARLDRQPQPVDIERRLEGGHDVPGSRHRGARGAEPAQQHGELVAAQPYDKISACGRLQPPRDFGQHPVAGRVSEGVVDFLEVIQIQQQQRCHTVLRCVGEAAAFLAQQQPVAETGELVMGRRVRVVVGQPLCLRMRGSIADRGRERGSESLEGVVLALREVHVALEYQAQRTDVSAGRRDRQRENGALPRLIRLGLRQRARADPVDWRAGQLDLARIGREQRDGAGRRDGQHLLQVDVAELLAGRGELAPCVALGAFAKSGAKGLPQQENRRRRDKQEKGIGAVQGERAEGAQHLDPQRDEFDVEVAQQLGAHRSAGDHCQHRDPDDGVDNEVRRGGQG
jgi:hypothetical protein